MFHQLGYKLRLELPLSGWGEPSVMAAIALWELPLHRRRDIRSDKQEQPFRGDNVEANSEVSPAISHESPCDAESA
ncbi:hypothetical protein NOSIN_00940 [Nocardiopsis sinuspersici]|uniref:Uncharacterized protein n=1 Tax=Nocardiopsis sinuspersici TaxID=501010 RepID=A0A1V3BWE6_9ACTN|nr:hypothetical protein NOSIN_00940 [Nocardiopsis sinuspersici]